MGPPEVDWRGIRQCIGGVAVSGEISNYDQLIDAYGQKATSAVFQTIFDAGLKLSENGVRCFHYKGSNQLALLYPDVDADGVTLFAMNFLEWVTGHSWDGLGERVLPEMIVGYSSLAPGTEDPEILLETAENLIEMQKV